MENAFKKFEEEAWEAKAPRYNDTWGTVTSQINEVILDLIPDRCKQLLDIGCGPGHLCGIAAKRGLDPVGADYSQAMVKIARQNYPALKFEKQDAENLTFPAGEFDAVSMNYLLLHVADQPKVIKEARRVLKPGGALVFSNWLPPDLSPGLGLIFGALKAHADMSVIPPAQDIFMFSNLSNARSFLENNGFGKVQSTEYETKWRIDSAERFFMAIQAGTRMGGLVDLQTPEIKARIKDQIFRDIERFKSGGGFVIPTPSLIISAEKL